MSTRKSDKIPSGGIKKNTSVENLDDYKIIISELGVNPFRMVRVAFALIGLIPFLVLFYVRPRISLQNSPSD